ncbi:MAG: dTMP kinase [Aphanocapsa sp. GSE-SYN-MK-11-07L]|jgi:dTMP kinase|nr:dTMP kinase [Aphanocapsa sp. GSE-SYN-MK-11-07L]
MSGKLIVFEGVEGGGKTSQIRRSQAWLSASGWLDQLRQTTPALPDPLLITREPGGTELGKYLRQLLLSPATQETLHDRAELMLYAADRAQHVEYLLKPHLAAGGLVLCDRFTDSTIAYQGYGRGLNLSLIQQLNQIATGGLTSDLTFWLDVEVSIGLGRAQQRNKDLDRMESATLSFHQRVQHGFQALLHQHPERIVRIDASQSEQVVFEQIQTLLSQRLQQWYPQLLPL